MHPEDRAQGWQQRAVFVSVVTPKGHGVRVNGKFYPMSQLICDGCNAVLTGSIAVATTMWRGDEPGDWESQYGQVLPPEAVNLADTLSGEPKPEAKKKASNYLCKLSKTHL